MISRFTALRLARLGAGYRLLDVAQHFALTEQAIGRMERLDLAVSDQQLGRSAALYNVPVAVLLGQQALTVIGAPPKRR